jgi:Flp pilus assembly pilin Flp
MLKAFWADESGQGLNEYAVIIALVSVALALVLIALRDEIGRVYDATRLEIDESMNRSGLGDGVSIDYDDSADWPGRGNGGGEGCPSVHGCNPSG